MTNIFKYLMLLASFGLLASDKIEKKEDKQISQTILDPYLIRDVQTVVAEYLNSYYKVKDIQLTTLPNHNNQELFIGLDDKFIFRLTYDKDGIRTNFGDTKNQIIGLLNSNLELFEKASAILDRAAISCQSMKPLISGSCINIDSNKSFNLNTIDHVSSCVKSLSNILQPGNFPTIFNILIYKLVPLLTIMTNLNKVFAELGDFIKIFANEGEEVPVDVITTFANPSVLSSLRMMAFDRFDDPTNKFEIFQSLRHLGKLDNNMAASNILFNLYDDVFPKNMVIGNDQYLLVNWADSLANLQDLGPDILSQLSDDALDQLLNSYENNFRVELWDLVSNKLLLRIPETKDVNDIALSKNGKCIALYYKSSKTISLVKNEKFLRSEISVEDPFKFEFSHDGSLLFVLTNDYKLKTIVVDSAEVIDEVSCSNFQISTDGKYMVAADSTSAEIRRNQFFELMEPINQEKLCVKQSAAEKIFDKVINKEDNLFKYYASKCLDYLGITDVIEYYKNKKDLFKNLKKI